MVYAIRPEYAARHGKVLGEGVSHAYVPKAPVRAPVAATAPVSTPVQAVPVVRTAAPVAVVDADPTDATGEEEEDMVSPNSKARRRRVRA